MKKALTVLMAATFLLACYAPVYAADWDLYGSARVNTWWTDESEERADTTTLDHDLQGNARIGANVDAGDIGGRFEYGTGGGNANIRLLYATVPMAGGELTVGQDYGPYGIGSFTSGQKYLDDGGLLQFVPYTGRKPQVKFNTENFSVALVKAQETFTDEAGVTTDPDAEVQLPQLQASYNVGLEGLALNFVGAVQSYDVDGGDGDTLTAYGLGLNARLTMLDPAYINFGGYYGQNVAALGQWSITRNTPAVIADDIEDTDTFAGIVVLGTQLQDNIGLEAGVGYASSDNDAWEEDSEVMAYYAQAPITVRSNFTITPEIGFYDYGDNFDTSADEGDDLYAGVQWRVDF